MHVEASEFVIHQDREKTGSGLLRLLATHVARVRDVELLSGLRFFPHMPSGGGDAGRDARLRTRLAVGLWERMRWAEQDVAEVCSEKMQATCPEG